MGKSSLRVRTMQRLKREEIACVAIDLTAIGTSGLSSEQWYNGIINNISESLKLEDKFDLDALWEENKRLSNVQVFGKFIDKVLKLVSTQIVIFIDEIDSILSLDFPVDDSFALIRAFFNQRVDNSEYNRINFVLLGVATPSELIQDKKRTPFNIGKGIELTGFEFTEALPLITGFSHQTKNPETVLNAVLDWTGGQPFLTQKVCNFICESKDEIPTGEEASFVENLVKNKVIENWESQDEPEHFRTIRDRILKRDENKAAYLLDLYQQVWISGEIDPDNSMEQSDLKLAGIVVKKNGNLKIYNRIYYTIFDSLWIEKTLASLRPYAESFRQWLLSGKQDKSRLLRGEALLDSSLVSGYESLKTEEDKNLTLEEKYKKAKEDFTKSIEKLPEENNVDNKDRSYLATLVYIYYVKAKLEKEQNQALSNYKIALEKYDILKSQLKSNTDLFKLDLNILYNGNSDIVADLYHQLNDLDKTNTVYYESLKAHLLNELDYLMQHNRWKDADLTNWQFILVSAKREKEGYLELNNIKNFNCNDLRKVDNLWLENSDKKFGYSVQKRIYLETGNSLDFDWKKGVFTKWSDEGYNSFAEKVGWKKGKEEGGDWMRYDELPLWEEKDLTTYKREGTLPSFWVFEYEILSGGLFGVRLLLSSCGDL